MSDYSWASSESSPVSNSYDWIKGFLWSGAESVPELIGITPSPETSEWRQAHPYGAFGSELLGMAVPYGGWFKATQLVGKFDKAVKAIGNIEKNPFIAGGAQEMARYFPFEAGRLAVSQVVGDKPFTTMAAETGINWALGGGIGGLLHGVAASGTRAGPDIKDVFTNIDIATAKTLQARHAKQVLDGMEAEVGTEAYGTAMEAYKKLLVGVRTEKLPEGYNYVGKLDKGIMPEANTPELAHQFNRIFRVENDSGVITSKRFAKTESTGFADDALWKAEAQQAGLPENFEMLGQHFRSVGFNPGKKGVGPEAAYNVDSLLGKNMLSVGDNWFATREAEDGMYLLARKYQGAVGRAATTDKWLLFKTDKPGEFLKDADKWAKTMADAHAWIPGANLAADGGEIYNTGTGFMKMFPEFNYKALQKAGNFDKVMDHLLPKGVRGPDNELFHRSREFLREYLAPRQHQFKQNPTANWIMSVTKTVYDAAEKKVQDVMNGVPKAVTGRSLIFNALSNTREPALYTPVRELVEKLTDDQMKEFWRLWRKRVPAEQLTEMQAKGEVSKEVMDFAQTLEKINQKIMTEMNLAEKAVDRRVTIASPGHYGLSKTWEGDTRIVLETIAGDEKAIVSGPNRRAAQANAARMMKEDPTLRVKGEYTISDPKSFELFKTSANPEMRDPRYLYDPKEVRGFRWDLDAFTKDEFITAFENDLRNRAKYQANIASNDILMPQLSKLATEDRAAFRQVVARMNDYNGVQTPWGKFQNQVTDQVLAPMIGNNSATKIVQYTNSMLFNLQLGAGKLVYPVANALQFVQTVLPEAAMALTAVPEHLAGRYTYFAAGGTKGTVGGMGILDPIKVMGRSFAEMRKPSKALLDDFERAARDRVVDPRIVEDYIGESAVKISNLRKAVSSGQNFTEWLRAVSEFMPAQTERLSRTHAFATGHIIARDFLGAAGKPIGPEQIYQFAKQFTENTMFQYMAADKPRIFTTPAGSALGLFKNWMFHFVAQMMEYTGQGVQHNNWAPLMWQTTGTAALGGISATPLFWAADGFSRMWNDKSLMVNAYDAYGQSHMGMGSVADGIMMGLPAALTGVSLYSQVNTPVANPVRDAATMFNIVAADRAKYLGKAVGAAFDQWQVTGEHPGKDRDVRDLIMRGLAPTTIYRTMQTIPWGGEGEVRSLSTGYPLTKNVPVAYQMLFGFGFNPAKMDREMAVSQELYAKKDNMKRAVEKLGDAFADAQRTNDSRQMDAVLRQAASWGVDVSSVIRSGMNRSMKETETAASRGYKPQDVQQYRSILDAL